MQVISAPFAAATAPITESATISKVANTPRTPPPFGAFEIAAYLTSVHSSRCGSFGMMRYVFGSIRHAGLAPALRISQADGALGLREMRASRSVQEGKSDRLTAKLVRRVRCLCYRRQTSHRVAHNVS